MEIALYEIVIKLKAALLEVIQESLELGLIAPECEAQETNHIGQKLVGHASVEVVTAISQHL